MFKSPIRTPNSPVHQGPVVFSNCKRKDLQRHHPSRGHGPHCDPHPCLRSIRMSASKKSASMHALHFRHRHSPWGRSGRKRRSLTGSPRPSATSEVPTRSSQVYSRMCSRIFAVQQPWSVEEQGAVVELSSEDGSLLIGLVKSQTH